VKLDDLVLKRFSVEKIKGRIVAFENSDGVFPTHVGVNRIESSRFMEMSYSPRMWG
jgi:hypothetical protein